MEIFMNVINVSWVIPAVSGILLFIDSVIFAILEGIIDLVFIVGTIDMSAISEDLQFLVTNIKSLVGVYILFKLSILFIQYLVEPDTFKDKSKGGESVLKNVIVVAVLLSLLSGNLLFGFFNDLQKVVFGTSGNYEVLSALGIKNLNGDNNDMIQKLVFGKRNTVKPAHDLTVEIAQQFIFTCPGAGLTNDLSNCTPNKWRDTIPPNLTFGIEYVDPNLLFGQIAYSTYGGVSFFQLMKLDGVGGWLSSAQYIAIISSIVGIYMIMKFMKLSLLVVIRFLKLLLMQILAPIAIVSYATPDGKKTFSNFWKTYFTIYMELFLRLFIMYISIYLMTAILSNPKFFPTGSYDIITNIILKILILVGISKFMDEMPELVSSFFGAKLGDAKQKSLTGILGGILGGGIGLATGVGGALSAGAGLGGAALSGGMGLFGGAKSGANSQNVGAFVSGQISNASKSYGKGFDIATAGGGTAYLQQQLDKTFGGGNKLRADAQKFKEQAEYHNNTSSNLDAIKAAAEKRYLKDMGYNSKDGWVNSQLGEYDKAVERLKNGQSSGMRHQTIDENGITWEGAEMSMDEVLASREQQAYKLGDKFDDNVDKNMWDKIQDRGNMNEEQLGKNAELLQAYDKFNAYETQMAKELGRTPKTITWDPIKNKTTRKFISDTAKGDAFKSQQAYDKFVNDKRFKNIGGK